MTRRRIGKGGILKFQILVRSGLTNREAKGRAVLCRWRNMTREATVMMMAMVLGQSKTPRLGIRIVIWIFSPSYVFQIGRMLCYQTLLCSALQYVP